MYQDIKEAQNDPFVIRGPLQSLSNFLEKRKKTQGEETFFEKKKTCSSKKEVTSLVEDLCQIKKMMLQLSFDEGTFAGIKGKFQIPSASSNAIVLQDQTSIRETNRVSVVRCHLLDVVYTE